MVVKCLMETNLGADQIGELHGLVEPLLSERETFLIEEKIRGDQLSIKVLGSRGTVLVVKMTDRGWRVVNTK